jgi:acetate kinase
MKILVLNCGSSSIKYALYNMDDQSVITSGGIEKIGLPDSCIIVKLNGEKYKMERPIEEHTAGVQWIF